MGVGESVGEPKALETVSEMTSIAGQKPALRRAKKYFKLKLREGVPIGCMVTLRGNRMYEFLDRFITLALPQVRIFVVFPQKVLMVVVAQPGVKEQIIFPKLITIELIIFAG